MVSESIRGLTKLRTFGTNEQQLRTASMREIGLFDRLIA
jgi:hypothetical protein